MVTYSGKQVWQNYIEPEDIPLKKNTSIALGELFTTDDDGYAIKATTAANEPTVFSDGVYQSLEKGEIGNAADDADGDVTIQAAKVRSRIAIECAADLVINNPVQTADESTTKVTKAADIPASYTIIGTVHSFDEQPDKRKSVDGDIAIIDFGLGVA